MSNCKFYADCDYRKDIGCPERCTQYREGTDLELVPVIHAHYVTDDSGDSSCSNCKEPYLDITQKYCPNCGALMDGGGKIGL